MIVWNVKHRLTWVSNLTYERSVVLGQLKNIAPKKNTQYKKRTGKKKMRDTSLILHSSVRGKELKCFSQNLTTNWNAIGATGTTQELTQLITQGLGLYQRLGRQVHLKRLQLVGLLHGAQTNLITDDAYNEVRIMVIEGAPNTSFAGIALNSVVEPKTFQYLHRVLLDRRIMLKVPARDSTGYLPALVPVDINVPMSMLVDYMSEAGNFTTSRSLYLYMVSDSALVPNPGFVTGYFNLEFTSL